MAKKKKDINRLKTSREFTAWAEREDCEIRQGKGSHVFIRKKGVTTTVPNHSGDLAAGTRRAIIKAFIAMGIAVLAVLLLLSVWF